MQSMTRLAVTYAAALALVIASPVALLTLASPATAKDYNSLKDYAAGRASYVSVSVADATGTAVDDGRKWLAIKGIQCGNKRPVVWREVKDVSDYYITTEHSRDHTFPRVRGKFTYDDATGETTLNGKQCKDAE